MMMVLGLYVFMLRTVPYQELLYQRSWRHAANSRVNRRPSTQFLGPDNDMLTLSGVLMPEITGGRLSLLALEQMAEQGKAWPLIEGSGTIYGMYVIEGLNQTKTEFFRDGMPRRGAVITLALGWKGQPLFPKGAFTVDEIEHTGAPDRLTIRARSADFRETLNTRREKSWHKTTVGEVVKEIAARHKLKMALGEDLSDKPVEHIDQTNESDGSFLMRLARQYGAIASVKNGNLLFIRQGQGKSASGKPLPVITITRKDGDSHRFTLADRGAYTGVIASWLHTREPAKKESTTVKRKRRTKKQKKEPEAKQGDYLVGTDENVLVLNRTYANRSNAERAAKMQWERLQRGVASFSLQLAEGRADLYTEMPVKVSGFKQPIDDAEWTITTLTHTVSPDNGFTTSLELEVRIDDFEME
ncbi:phage late control D family protein [Salmonella enterica subsp. enterica serovar Typhi]|nr:phage late control D family protein [Salmonella enterica subsp. enterica serovar Typhi]